MYFLVFCPTIPKLSLYGQAVVSGASLADLEEFRVRTVEAQAAVEDLRDELSELVSESREYETQVLDVDFLILFVP